MPSRNIVKTYIADGYYHIYNRGVEKRDIFLDEQDYRVFLRYLREAVSPPSDSMTLEKLVTFKGETFKGIPRQPKNFYKNVEIIAYILMTNHFHIVIHQHNESDMKELIQSVCTRYCAYFNKRYKRVGTLFQGPYKAVFVDSEEYLLHVTRYIHRNMHEIGGPFVYPYSSYSKYIGKSNELWIHPEIVLSYFSTEKPISLKRIHTYQSFVEQYEQDESEILGNLGIDVDTL